MLSRLKRPVRMVLLNSLTKAHMIPVKMMCHSHWLMRYNCQMW